MGIRETGAEVSNSTPDVRERLTDAVTRVATECGYPDVDVDLIAQYADVSTEEFYRHFAGKDQCLLAAYDRFLERLGEHVEEACQGAEHWPDRVKLTIEAAFEFVSELDGAARLFAVDSMRTGPAAVERNCNAVDAAALRLKHGRLLFPAAADMPDPTERTLVAGVVMIASIQLLSEEADQLPRLAPEAVEMVLTPYIGARRARSIAIA